jgi:tRNA threonylcarbamoyladenosine biosynthesis protein TsaE
MFRRIEMVLVTHTEHETIEVGRRLGEACVPGLVIGLSGQLGAGKTRLTQGLAAGLGIESDEVTSPTFGLIHEYCGRLMVYHFDTYRLPNEQAFLDLGAEEMFEAGGVCVIEWASRVPNSLPEKRLEIEIEAAGETTRRVILRGFGDRDVKVLRAAFPAESFRETEELSG